MMFKKNRQKGFTLLELIVCAAIIAMLVSVVIARLDTSRQKGRDAKKVSELKNLQTALELLQLDLGRYPDPANFSIAEPAQNGGTFTSMTTVLAGNGTYPGVVTRGYMSAIPVPPVGSSVPLGDYYYYQTRNGGGVIPECDGKRLDKVPYIIYFATELPRNLPLFTNNGTPPSPGYWYCLSL